MAGHRVTVWWHKQKRAWCTEIDRKRFTLAKGRANKQQALDALDALLRERELLASVNGAISVAGLCERFLADAEEHLSPATYESYQYGCQKLVDALGGRLAHTLRPDDIATFSLGMKATLNDTSRAIVLRTIQRCFNWGVETRLIPAHELGRIRDRPVDMQELHEDFKRGGPSPRHVRVGPNKTMLPADFGPPRAMAARIAVPVASPANETKGPAAEPG